ncbi:unnamed protein product [Caenorhabditis auriculariae]|uniref:Activator of Hsp90 ATPase AHSA1-like N-terminal domain-containing protein n=1 Tax=Caenorhabditis auriculariae TaxID=2777116 RepID=A0A8S1HIE3_9PELO|nr:unnamed protein product [Caenorhabditis auriculariae]
MAKWGEGDPRWIVEERADATNVNNWHWSEKNATPWSRDRLSQLLQGLVIEDGSIVIKLDEIKKLEGEATANNRKAKLIFLYEWVIEVSYTARVTGTDTEYKGKIEVPNLSDENSASELDVSSTLETKGPHEAQIRNVLKKKGTEVVQEALGAYIRELKEEFSKGLILPTDQVKPQVVSKGKTTIVDKRSFQNAVIANPNSSSEKTESFDVKSINVSDNFKVNPERLFEVLSQEEFVRVWANGNIQWDFKPEGKFALFGGNVSGSFVKIEPNKEIVTKWRLKGYPGSHHATIRFFLKDTGSSTDLIIEGSDVPTDLADDTQTGLNRFYLASIARTFGFSSRMC